MPRKWLQFWRGRRPTPSFQWIYYRQLFCLYTLCILSLFYPFIVDVGEECVPDQFLSFPGLTRSVRSPTISSGREVEHLNTCSTVCLALHLHFHSVPHSAPRCHHRASVWQVVAASIYCLPVCFHIYDVRKMCAQEGDCVVVSIAHYSVRYQITGAGYYCLLIQKLIDMFVLWRNCHGNRPACTLFTQLYCVCIVCVLPHWSDAQGTSMYCKIFSLTDVSLSRNKSI